MELFTDIFEYQYLMNAFLAAIFAGIVCGIVGTYVVARRMVFLCGGITHSSFGGLGVAFYGENATLYLSGGNDYKICDMKGKVIKDVKSELQFEEGNLLNPSEALDVFHFRNWFDAIRKGTKLNSDIVEACISTQLVQYGNIAQRVGHSLDIDPISGRILNADREVNQLWGRKYEKGWEPKL